VRREELSRKEREIEELEREKREMEEEKVSTLLVHASISQTD